MKIPTTSTEAEIEFFRQNPVQGGEEMSPEEALSKLSSKNYKTRMYVATLPQLPDEGLTLALDDTNPSVRAAALLHPHAPEQAVEAGLHSNSRVVQIAAAASPNITPELLEETARTTTDARVLDSVALHSKASPELLEEMLEAGKQVSTVVRNPNLATETLSQLWNANQPKPEPVNNIFPDDEETTKAREKLHAMIAGGPDVHLDLITEYFATFDGNEFDKEEIRKGILANPKCPPEIAVKALFDPSESVQNLAAQNPNVPGEVLEKILSIPSANDFYLREPLIEGAFQNPSLQPEAMNAALENQHGGSIVLMLRRDDIPSEVLDLAYDIRPELRREILDNKNAPKSTLEKAFMDDPHGFGKSIARSAQATPVLLEAVYDANLPDNTPSEFNPAIAAQVRGTVVKNPNASEELVETAAQDTDPEVRRKALSHPKISVETLAHALDDPDPKVKAGAEVAISNRGLTAEVAEVRKESAASKNTEHRYATLGKGHADSHDNQCVTV